MPTGSGGASNVFVQPEPPENPTPEMVWFDSDDEAIGGFPDWGIVTTDPYAYSLTTGSLAGVVNRMRTNRIAQGHGVTISQVAIRVSASAGNIALGVARAEGPYADPSVIEASTGVVPCPAVGYVELMLDKEHTVDMRRDSLFWWADVTTQTVIVRFVSDSSGVAGPPGWGSSYGTVASPLTGTAIAMTSSFARQSQLHLWGIP